MMKNVDTLVVDLPDVGARYYTYLWTAKLCMEACAEKGIRMVVLDRPNPLGGILTEGPVLDRNHRTFVGLFEIPIRHGMTMGELLTMMNKEENINCSLEVVRMDGWNRTMWFDETGFPWVMPSPNMPTLDTASVYPGFCLLEATNISEGRGTTRPFELCGAPFIDPHELVTMMNRFKIPGVFFRPTYFVPTFDKYKGEQCGGFQMHVLDRDAFPSVITAAALLLAVRMLYGDKLKWNDPPYEYEYEKLPIDILWGDSSLREVIDARPEFATFATFQELQDRDMSPFMELRESYLLY